MMSDKSTPNRHISGKKKAEDQTADKLIRPQQLDEFIGQARLEADLSILLEAAQVRQEPLDHVL